MTSLDSVLEKTLAYVALLLKHKNPRKFNIQLYVLYRFPTLSVKNTYWKMIYLDLIWTRNNTNIDSTADLSEDNCIKPNEQRRLFLNS